MKRKQPTLFDLPKTEEEKRLDVENLMWGVERPKPTIGDACVIFGENTYWNCHVTHISRSGKTFWAETVDRKIYFRDVPVSKFKPVLI
jgi:hypothetical protein